MLFFSTIESEAQFMKKLKQKASKGLLKEIGVGDDKKEAEPANQDANSNPLILKTIEEVD